MQSLSGSYVYEVEYLLKQTFWTAQKGFGSFIVHHLKAARR
ncbi:hypothetical protein HanRHA438_Chr00c43g0857621 [Helianthus annuus]|nr:hypothetical protein HanRHA438_Chr00c43g0857621 [Helianthus annuus]